jgi:hypothetical protein
MANWIIRVTELYFETFVERFRWHLAQMQRIHIDETHTQVIKEKGRNATTNSYMWVYLSAKVEDKSIVVFDYSQTRSHKSPERFLEGFSGSIHCDGYSGYDVLSKKSEEIILSGCWAHVRRKYEDALKVLPNNAEKTKTVAYQGKKYCDKLFWLEKTFEFMSLDERFVARQEKSKPLLDEFLKWIHANMNTVLPKGLLGKAMQYTLNQWQKLLAFLDDGGLEISNNRAERAIRYFVVGRKNSLFSYTPRGAKASAIMYSMVETAKLNGLIPYQYIKYLLSELSQMDYIDPTQIDHLMPWSSSIPEICFAPKQPP